MPFFLYIYTRLLLTKYDDKHVHKTLGFQQQTISAYCIKFSCFFCVYMLSVTRKVISKATWYRQCIYIQIKGEDDDDKEPWKRLLRVRKEIVGENMSPWWSSFFSMKLFSRLDIGWNLDFELNMWEEKLLLTMSWD